MAALEALLSLSSSLSLSASPKFLSSSKPSPQHSIKLPRLTSTSLFSLSSNSCSSNNHNHNHCSSRAKDIMRFQLWSTVQETPVDTETEETQEENLKRRLIVLNLPWSFSDVDIKNLFAQCGTVSDVEIMKQKNGRSRGFAFVTMSSEEESQAALDKFNSNEVSGRIIRVEFAKRLKKPPPEPPVDRPPAETRHKIYVSNLAWKVRANNLREFFSADFSPVSSKVVFESPGGRSAGYGFVSFATKEEAEAAISGLDGKELMGRPVRLKFSEAKTDELASKQQEEKNSDNQTDEK